MSVKSSQQPQFPRANTAAAPSFRPAPSTFNVHIVAGRDHEEEQDGQRASNTPVHICKVGPGPLSLSLFPYAAVHDDVNDPRHVFLVYIYIRMDVDLLSSSFWMALFFFLLLETTTTTALSIITMGM